MTQNHNQKKMCAARQYDVPLGVFEGFRDLKAVGRAVVAGIAGRRRRRGWLIRGAVFCISSGGGLKHFVHSIKVLVCFGSFC